MLLASLIALLHPAVVGRERPGGEAYAGGFPQHYAFGRLGVDGSSGPAQLAQRLLVGVPDVVAYALLALHLRRDRRSAVAVPA